jgi:hypothetical protein
MQNNNICSVCDCNIGVDVFEVQNRLRVNWIECPVCGRYMIDTLTSDINIRGMLKKIVKGIFNDYNDKTKMNVDEGVAFIRHYVYTNPYKWAEQINKFIFISVWNDELCKKVCTESFPDYKKQLGYLIEFLGKELKYPGSTYRFGDSSDNLIINKLKLISAIASINDKNLEGICDWTTEERLIKLNNNESEKILCLTHKGYKKYEEILKSSL